MILKLAARSRSALIAPRTTVQLVVAGDEVAAPFVELLASNRFEVEVHRLGCGSINLDVETGRASAIVIALTGARGANLLAATLCRQVRQRDVLIPILCVAGPASAGSKSQVLEAGADDVITLPLDEIEFLARLSAQVRKARAVQSLLGDRSPVHERPHWFTHEVCAPDYGFGQPSNDCMVARLEVVS